MLGLSQDCMVWFVLKQQILDSLKLKEFAEDNVRFDENGRKFSKWVESTVGKGEIAWYKQFLLFPIVFSKDLLHRHVKTRACLGKGWKGPVCLAHKFLWKILEYICIFIMNHLTIVIFIPIYLPTFYMVHVPVNQQIVLLIKSLRFLLI